MNLKDEEYKTLTQKYHKLQEEFSKVKHSMDLNNNEEKIQILSKEIERLTELTNSQSSETHHYNCENETLKTQLDLHKAKIIGQDHEINELKLVNSRLIQEKKTVEVQKIYVQDNAEYNEKLRSLTIELENLKAVLDEKMISLKSIELEKIEIFKSNEKLFKDLEHWRKEAIKFEIEVKEILLRLRSREIELEEFRNKSFLHCQDYENRLGILNEELMHWKGSYEQLAFQEIPRLRESLMHKEFLINQGFQQQQPPPIFIQNPPIIQSPPIYQSPPIIHNPPMNHHDDHDHHDHNEREDHERIKELIKKIDFLERELEEKNIYISKFKQTVSDLERDIRHLREHHSEKTTEITDCHNHKNEITRLEQALHEKSMEIKNLHIQIEEKNTIINRMRNTEISFKDYSIPTGGGGSSNEFYKIEVMKLQKILKEKNQEIQNIRLRLEHIQRTSKTYIRHEHDERIALLEKELEYWKTRYSENMTISMNVREEAYRGDIKDDRPIIHSHEKKVLKDSNTNFYIEKINALKIIIEGKDQEILVWQRKYEDLYEAYKRLEVAYEKDLGEIVTKETVIEDFNYQKKTPNRYVVEVETKNHQGASMKEFEVSADKKDYGNLSLKEGFDEKKYEKIVISNKKNV